MHQAVNLDRVSDLLRHRPANIVIERSLLRSGKLLSNWADELVFDGETWTGTGETFELNALPDDAWDAGSPLAYLETHIRLIGEGSFAGQFAPPFYTVYAGERVKTLFSDNALKYGNTVTIYQMQAFGSWVEGYPAATVDPARDTTESVVLINPFAKSAVADVTLEGVEGKQRVRMPALSGARIDLHKLFALNDDGWSGQFFVSGRNRLIVLTAKHSMSRPSDITTIEHSNPYRGELTHKPVTVLLRRRIGEALWSEKAGQ